MENRVRELREGAGETQQRLGDVVDVSRQTINSIESGRYSPSVELAFKLARHYSTTIEEIFSYDESCLCHPSAPAMPDGQLSAPAPPA